MTDLADLLLRQAACVLRGEEYHAWLARRLEAGGDLPHEVVVPPGGRWETLRDPLYGPWARAVRRRGHDPAEPPADLAVAAFVGERVAVVSARAFRDLLCELEGLNRAALGFRVARWLAE